MELIVMLDGALAASMRGDAAPTPASRALADRLADLGCAITPLFPGIDDPDLAGQFRSDVPDGLRDDALDDLRAQPGVLAAYLKAPGLPPT